MVYFSNLRNDLISLIYKKDVKTILELGGGEFDTLNFLINKFNASGVGIDQRKPKNTKTFEFYQGDLDNPSIFEALGDRKFDLIIAGDVLEHTSNPEIICTKLMDLLDDDGIFILSVPNIRNIKAFFWIFIMGTFPRNEKGLFDKTNRSWFTYSDLKGMLLRCGYLIMKYKPLGRLEPLFFGRRTIFSEFLPLQHAFIVRKNR